LVETFLKVVVLGENAVGKTSICRRYVYDEFPNRYDRPSILSLYYLKKTLIDGNPVTLYLQDIAGIITGSVLVEDQRTMHDRVRGTRGIILVYDISNQNSFDQLIRWIGWWFYEISKRLPPIAIVGNKADLGETAEDAVSITRGQEFADKVSEKMETSTLFMEVSAKTGENIESLFIEFARIMRAHDDAIYNHEID
jgi:small GTP-binding protein